MKFFTLIAVLAGATATASPTAIASPTEYHYFKSDGTEIALGNHSLPITVGGVPIGTTELSPESAPSHHLSSGHHFGHENWVINGSSWQYIENLGDRRASYDKKIYTGDSSESLTRRENMETFFGWHGTVGHMAFMYQTTAELVYESSYLESVSGVAAPYDELLWDATGSASELVMDLWATDVVTSTPIASFVELVDEVLNLLFDAFGFFTFF